MGFLTGGFGATEAATYAAMEGLAGGGALAGGLGAIGTAIPWVGAALLAFSLLSGDGGGPKPGEVLLSGGPGSWHLGNNNLPDRNDAANEAYLASFTAALNDPAQFDQSILAQFAGRTVSGVGSAQDGAQQLMQILAPASQKAQGTSQAFLAQLMGSGSITSSLQGYVDSQKVSEFLSPEDRLAGAQSLFDAAVARAAAGDVGAGQALPGLANTLLGAGRQMYASGGQFQCLSENIDNQLARVLTEQGAMQLKLLDDMPASIREGTSSIVAAIQKTNKDLIDALHQMADALRQSQVTGVPS
jgi:hypothetical protein